MQVNPRVFISYARADGAAFATRLRTRLEGEYGIPVWQDICSLPPGELWWKEIEKTLRHEDLEYLVLVMTSGALASATVQKEIRLARSEGKCVIPILAEKDLNKDRLHPCMKARHLIDPDNSENWDRFIATLRTTCQALKVVNTAPRPKPGFIERAEPLERLKALLLDRERRRPRAVKASLVGTGGFGKTTLAKALCYDAEVQEVFCNGILWVPLGKKPGDLTGLVLDQVFELCGQRPAYAGLYMASSRLRDLLTDSATLIVIDDLWNPAHAEPFLFEGSRCSWVITSRNRHCLPDPKSVVAIDQMTISEAAALLATDLDQAPRDRLRVIAKTLGRWPQLLALANGFLRKKIGERAPLETALNDLERAYELKGPVAFDPRRTGEQGEEHAFDRALKASLDLLTTEDLKCYLALTVFVPDLDIPVAVIARLWKEVGGLDEMGTHELCSDLDNLSLLRLDLGDGTVRIDTVIRNALIHRCNTDSSANRVSWHRALLASYAKRTWWEAAENEPYLWRHLTWHLFEAGYTGHLKSLLLDYHWLAKRLQVTGLTALSEDFCKLPDDPDLRLVTLGLRLASRYLIRDPVQLAAQLRGRLSATDHPALQPLLDSLNQGVSAPVLLHRFPTLTQPGGMLICAFTQLDDPIIALAISPDGSQGLSGSLDAKARLWDLGAGEVLAVLENRANEDPAHQGHDRAVTAVAFAKDGDGEWTQVLSGSSDRRAILWDIASGKPLRTMGANVHGSAGHQGTVTAVVCTGDGGNALTGADDGSLILWDLNTGEPRLRLAAEPGRVATLAIFAQGNRALAATHAGDLRVWNLASLKALHQTAQQGGELNALVVLAARSLAVMAAPDGCVLAGELEPGERLLGPGGLPAGIPALAVFPDRRHAVAGYGDGTLILWDLEQNRDTARVTFRPDKIHALAAVGDGSQVLVASGNGRLELLDLSAHPPGKPLDQHSGQVISVTLLDGESQALSGGLDGVLRLWDLASGASAGKSDTTLAGIRAISSQAADGSVWVATDGGKLWRFARGVAEPPEQSVWNAGQVTALAIDGTGVRLILGTRDGSVWTWQPEKAGVPVRLGGHRMAITAIDILDVNFVLTGCEDGSLILWDLTFREIPVEFLAYDDPDGDDPNRVTGFAIAHDRGQVLVGHANGDLRILDLDTTETVRFIGGNRGRVTGIAMLPGATAALVSAEDDQSPLDYGSLSLYHLMTGESLTSLIFEAPPSALALTRDGHTAVVGDSDGRVHVIEIRRT